VLVLFACSAEFCCLEDRKSVFQQVQQQPAIQFWTTSSLGLFLCDLLYHLARDDCTAVSHK
jgi:hypothetical protein